MNKETKILTIEKKELELKASASVLKKHRKIVKDIDSQLIFFNKISDLSEQDRKTLETKEKSQKIIRRILPTQKYLRSYIKYLKEELKNDLLFELLQEGHGSIDGSTGD